MEGMEELEELDETGGYYSLARGNKARYSRE